MMGNFLTRALVLAFGYAYPAYECYKTVELNRPEIEQLIFWCQYWILVAVLTVLERFGDVFISWLPMYSEAKLALFVYLWSPKTKGTTYIYQTFLQPYIAKHENEIDRNILELRARAGDLVVLYWQKVSTYSQTTFFDVLQFVASQSPSRSKPVQPRQPPQQIRRTASIPAARQPAASKQLQEPSAVPASPKIQRQDSKQRSPKKPAVQLQELEEVAAEAVPPSPPVDQPPESEGLASSSSSPSSPTSKDTTAIPIADGEGEAMPIEVTKTTGEEDPNPPQEVTPIEDAIRVTRSKLRKRVATVAP